MSAPLYARKNLKLFTPSAVSTSMSAATFAQILSGDPAMMQGLLARVDGQPAGIVHYVFHRTCWKIEKVCYLQDLFADPAFRGRGLGRALIEAVHDRADAMGAPAVYWLTQDFNSQARRLYDRIGVPTPFIEYDRPE